LGHQKIGLSNRAAESDWAIGNRKVFLPRARPAHSTTHSCTHSSRHRRLNRVSLAQAVRHRPPRPNAVTADRASSGPRYHTLRHRHALRSRAVRRGASSSCRPPRTVVAPSAEAPPPAAVRLGRRSCRPLLRATAREEDRVLIRPVGDQ
jgi:hypothetical protein